jgi:hypothetical protein
MNELFETINQWSFYLVIAANSSGSNSGSIIFMLWLVLLLKEVHWLQHPIGSSADTNLPSQCTSYTINADSTRSVTNTGCQNCISDTSAYLTAGWYRFTEGAGTRLLTTPPSTTMCGATYPGWFNGTLPTTVGATSTGSLCINYASNLCYVSWSSSPVSATNCNGFYVFYLTPILIGSSRYCTTAWSTS